MILMTMKSTNSEILFLPKPPSKRVKLHKDRASNLNRLVGVSHPLSSAACELSLLVTPLTLKPSKLPQAMKMMMMRQLKMRKRWKRNKNKVKTNRRKKSVRWNSKRAL